MMQSWRIAGRWNKLLAWSLAGVLVLGTGWLAWAWWFGARNEEPARYVGLQTCGTCHPRQVEEWAGSHHDLAMCEANAATVLGSFDNQHFTHQGITSRLFRQGDRFFITTDGPTGQIETFPIKYTFGLHPLQQYLVELDRGRLQALSVAWATDEKQWFHLYPNEKIPHDDWLHWTKGGQNWNYMCAECHSTNLQKNYDLATDSYRTTWSEINVSCEACHGPGSAHVELARSSSLMRDRRWRKESAYGLATVKEQKTQIDACARCHARRGIAYPDFHAGAAFLDHYVPELLDTELYFPDGQIRDEVYEYGSFLQSRMYREKVRCTDCHEPHSARLRAEGNNLCTRCHLPAKYDTRLHHHHEIASKGSLCVECHMPRRTYMVVDPRRDHSLRVPRPDQSAALGTPNACNACHTDRKPEWASEQIVSWYGTRRPDDPHFGPAIAAGRAGRPEGENLLLALAKRPNTGPMVRASAVALLGRYSSLVSQDALTTALSDSEPMVRYAAARGLEGHSADELIRFLPPLLEDRVRLVRIEAARVLSAAPVERLSGKQQKAFQQAVAEFERGQLATSDQAGSHHNLGVVYGNLNQLVRAETEYRTALRLDPRFLPARFNLALLYNRQHQNAEAEKVLREVIGLAPDNADAHYSLGLLLAEDDRRLAEAAQTLGTAARLAPNRARVHYNHGLALQRLGRPGEAESAFLSARKLEPNTPDVLNALAVLNAQQGRVSDALRWVDELIRIDPGNPRWQTLRQQLLRGERQE